MDASPAEPPKDKPKKCRGLQGSENWYWRCGEEGMLPWASKVVSSKATASTKPSESGSKKNLGPRKRKNSGPVSGNKSV